MVKTLDVARELLRISIDGGDVEDGEIIRSMFPGITSDDIKHAKNVLSDQLKMFREDARERLANLKELAAEQQNQVGPPNARFEWAAAELESMCVPNHLLPDTIFPRKPDKAKSWEALK